MSVTEREKRTLVAVRHFNDMASAHVAIAVGATAQSCA